MRTFGGSPIAEAVPPMLEEMALVSGTDGWVEQWANVWPDQSDEVRWLPKRITDLARATGAQVPEQGWCGVETPFERDDNRWAVVVVWPTDGVDVAAKVIRVDSIDDVVTVVGDRRVVAHPTVCAQLLSAGKRQGVEPINVPKSRAATETLAKLLRAGRVRVEGIADEEWRAVRTAPADGGEMIDGRRSEGDVAAVKALSWGVWSVEVARHTGPVLVA